MHKKHNAQRQHIIYSFDALLFQLFVLSYFMSPSLWSLLLRIVYQFQCTRPKDFESSRSLRFCFLGAIFFNASSVWHHARDGASEGRAIILDFVGMSFTPSKLQLLSLDFFIIFLQLVLANIAYEQHLCETEGEEDVLLPLQPPPSPISTEATYLSPTDDPKCAAPPIPQSPYVLDLRLSSTMTRLRHPSPRRNNADNMLPLPNTTSWPPLPLPASFQVLMRSTARVRRAGRQTRNRDGPIGDTPETNSREGRMPGALDVQAT
ncbi:hypothetical protein BDN71DRAFT_1439178 [Pleurotus eryngii]|uniref:DUF1746 domain-containing protein n=1 Tax=Pleurotus eryngii TaxID=5323 RepID=A0A9P6DJW5_PLEER|nr:hypothetical protein BDN71DRAFT_1439178 [Pleurotus eryngii]